MEDIIVHNSKEFEEIVSVAYKNEMRFRGSFFKSNGSPWFDYPFIIRKNGNIITMKDIDTDFLVRGEYTKKENMEAVDVRSYNIGNSDYSKHKIQPWQIWIEYKLNPFDADIVKRVLRHKKGEPRKMDYEKIIHICQERLRQIAEGEDPWKEEYKD